MTYEATRTQVETYFDRTATQAWERLTSDAPVSGIRATVRAGRDRMRDVLLAQLPADLTGARVLDAPVAGGPARAASPPALGPGGGPEGVNGLRGPRWRRLARARALGGMQASRRACIARRACGREHLMANMVSWNP